MLIHDVKNIIVESQLTLRPRYFFFFFFFVFLFFFSISVLLSLLFDFSLVVYVFFAPFFGSASSVVSIHFPFARFFRSPLSLCNIGKVWVSSSSNH